MKDSLNTNNLMEGTDSGALLQQTSNDYFQDKLNLRQKKNREHVTTDVTQAVWHMIVKRREYLHHIMTLQSQQAASPEKSSPKRVKI